MNPTLANQLLFELMVFKSKTDADKLCTRKRELCGKSRDTAAYCDYNELPIP